MGIFFSSKNDRILSVLVAMFLGVNLVRRTPFEKLLGVPVEKRITSGSFQRSALAELDKAAVQQSMKLSSVTRASSFLECLIAVHLLCHEMSRGRSVSTISFPLGVRQ